MDKGKKGTRRLSLYIQPSDFQGAVFFVSSIHIFAKKSASELRNYSKFICSSRVELYKFIPSSSS